MDRTPRIFEKPDQSATALWREFRPTKTLPLDGVPDGPAEQRYDAYVKKVIDRAFQNEEFHKSLELTLAPRTVAAWRITRAIARISGLIPVDGLLCEVSTYEPDQLYIPGYYSARTHAAVAQTRVGLRPPENDEGIPFWTETIRVIAEELQLSSGSAYYPSLGIHGVRPLCDPRTARIAWPSTEQIVLFEQILVEDAFQLIVEKSTAEARSETHRKYGLQPYETNEVIKMARRESVYYADSTPEQDAAIMALRLEKLYNQAQEAYDTRAALGALKQLGLVQGLTRTETKNPFDDIVEALGTVRSSTKALPPSTSGGESGE